jgi:hypothetical protein
VPSGLPVFARFCSRAPKLTLVPSLVQLTGLIDDRGGEFEQYRRSDAELKGIKNKRVRQFYENQNEILVCFFDGNDRRIQGTDLAGCSRAKDGFAEVDEILDNTRAKATTGELAPMIPVKPSQGREDEFNAQVQFAVNVNLVIVGLVLSIRRESPLLTVTAVLPM